MNKIKTGLEAEDDRSEEHSREQCHHHIPHEELDGESGRGGGGGEADAGSIGGLSVSGRSGIGRSRELRRRGVGLSCGVGS